MSNISATQTLPTLDRILEIWADAAAAGEAMPSEPSLAARLGVSRPAVREALIRLEERGFLHRSQGTETSVNRSLLAVGARIDEQREHAEVIEQSGARAQMRVVRQEVAAVRTMEGVPADIDSDTLAMVTVKVWTANGTPVTMATDAVPLPPGWNGETDAAVPVFEVSHLLGTPVAVWETVCVSPVTLSSVEAWLLGRDEGSLALRLDLHGVDASGNTAYWSREFQPSGGMDLSLVRHIRPTRTHLRGRGDGT